MRAISAMIVIGLLMTASPLALAEAKHEHAHYVAAHVLAVTCGPEQHEVIDTDPRPDEYKGPDGWIGWALSGEPECVPSDALNAAREANGGSRTTWGIGGAAHTFDASDVGSVAFASAEDEALGPGAGYLHLRASGYGDQTDAAAEGCGPQGIVLPDVFPFNRVADSDDWVAFVHVAGVDDDLTPCFATTGVLHAHWGE